MITKMRSLIWVFLFSFFFRWGVPLYFDYFRHFGMSEVTSEGQKTDKNNNKNDEISPKLTKYKDKNRLQLFWDEVDSTKNMMWLIRKGVRRMTLYLGPASPLGFSGQIG